MPPTNILVTDIDATNTDKLHQVYLTDFNTVTQLGDDIDDTSLGVGTFYGARGKNPAIAVWGSVYCMSRLGIYRLQTGSQYGVWSNDPADGGYTFSASYQNHRAWSSLNFMSINNTPYLVGQYGDTARNFRFNLLTGEGEEGPVGVYGFTRPQDIVYGSTHFGSNGLQWYIANFVTLNQEYLLTFPGSGDNAGNNGETWDYHIFNNKLYALGFSRISGGFGKPTLYEFSGGGFKAVITDFEASQDTYSRIGCSWCLFDDGTKLYVLYWDDQAGQLGWNMWEVNLIGGQLVKGNELTNTVLPASLRPGGGPNSSSAWSVYKELQTDGTVDIYLIYSASTGASTSTLYQFINSATELVSVGSGIDSRYQTSRSRFGDGTRSVDLTSPSICVYARERDILGEKVTFRVFPPIQPAMDYDGTNLTVNFNFATNYNVPTTAATLVGDVTGKTAARSGDLILNVESDGVTDYTAIISSSDFNDFDNVNIIAEVN